MASRTVGKSRAAGVPRGSTRQPANSYVLERWRKRTDVRRSPAPVRVTEQRSGSAATTFDGLAEDYLRYMAAVRDDTQSTVKAYASDYRCFSRFLEAECCSDRLQDLEEGATVQRYFESLTGFAPTTRRRRMHSLSSLFRFAVRHKVMAFNPVVLVEPPKKRRHLPEYLRAEEVNVLICAAETPVERGVLVTFLSTGMRKSELISLDLRDIDWEKRLVKVDGKGRKDRVIPMTPQMVDALNVYLSTRAVAPSEDALFVNSVGNRVCATFVQNLFVRCIRRAGLAGKGYTIHSLRHTFATHLCWTNTDLKTLQELLGHEDISTTSLYLHTSDGLKRDAVGKLPDIYNLSPESL